MGNFNGHKSFFLKLSKKETLTPTHNTKEEQSEFDPIEIVLFIFYFAALRYDPNSPHHHYFIQRLKLAIFYKRLTFGHFVFSQTNCLTSKKIKMTQFNIILDKHAIKLLDFFLLYLGYIHFDFN